MDIGLQQQIDHFFSLLLKWVLVCREMDALSLSLFFFSSSLFTSDSLLIAQNELHFIIRAALSAFCLNNADPLFPGTITIEPKQSRK